MQPSDVAAYGSGPQGGIRRPIRQPQDSPIITRSLSSIRRLRSDESWIEVSSQPSSSSLSSVATDEVVTTGLRVQQDRNPRRRRRLHRLNNTHMQGDMRMRATSAAGSSQEEYEESESESDPTLSSSNEGLQTGFRQEEESPHAIPSSTSEGPSTASDEDENSTALGLTDTTEPVFTPQPNAFSHPPISRQTQSAATAGSYFPAPQPNTTSSQPVGSRPSFSTQRTRTHTPYTMLMPSYTADHDAALRASLSTLLSCAAAARGLPKRESSNTQLHTGTSNRIDPSTIRLIPESAMPASAPKPPPCLQRNPSSTSSCAPFSPTLPAQGKRKAASRDRRDVRKKRRSGIEDITISPTLMTWVVSAGVVVLFSAISFSAGYTYGREMGRIEGIGEMGAQDCAREGARVGGTMRRMRWGNASVGAV